MLRPSSIARKIVRLRTSRSIAKAYYHPLQNYTPNHLERLPPPTLDPRRPRLYVPEDFEKLKAEAEAEADDVVEAADTPEQSLKAHLTQLAEEDHEELDERALMEFYSAVVESGAEELEALDLPQIGAPRSEKMSREKVHQVLTDLEKRMVDLQIVAPRAEASMEIAKKPEEVDLEKAVRVAAALSAIKVPSSSNAVLGFSIKGKEKAAARPADISMGLVTSTEWEALFESFMYRKDTRGAEALLAVMMQHRARPSEEQLNRIIRYDSYEGRTEEISRLISSYTALGGEISSLHHNAILTSLSTASPQTALQYLREYERKGDPLPQECYDHMLTQFTVSGTNRQATSQTRALAWELFTHMRMHAYPTPDKEVYSTMIRACADSNDPQPERARDLWIEMTTEGNQVKPTRNEYDAVIRALSSTKAGCLEAFDLLREMLARHREVVVAPFSDTARKLWSPYVPTLTTWKALLEGTKRAGDIERARWVLSEFIGLVGSSLEMQQPMEGPDEDVLTSVFMTYAAWKPKITRRGVKSKAAEDEVDNHLHASNLEKITAAVSVATGSEKKVDSARAPKSAADAVREAQALFDRVLLDNQATTKGETNFFVHPFNNVKLRTRLVNSFLSVMLEHSATTEQAYLTWSRTWEQVAAVDASVVPNGWSYMMLLERCGAGRRKDETAEDKAMAAAWGKRVWKEYIDYVAANESGGSATTQPSAGTAIVVNELRTQMQDKRQRWLAGLGPRQIEKCWRSIIRIYALTDHTAVALALLQEFQRRYPPEEVYSGYEPLKNFVLGSRVVDTTRTPEADVPPHLLFTDVDVLHQRLARKEDHAAIAKLKYITKEYEHALLKRRSFRRKAVGVPREREVYQKEFGQLEVEAPKGGKALKGVKGVRNGKKGDKARQGIAEPASDEDMEMQWPGHSTPRRRAWAEYA